MSVKIIYKDIAIGADTDAAISSTPHTGDSTPSELPFGIETGAVATCELNSWGLNHDYKVKDTQPFAFWSENISNNECTFDYSPTIVIDFNEKYTSTGLTLRFSPATYDYCSKITAVWYQDSVEIDRGTYYPTTPFYVLENAVEGFNKIELIFEKTSLPNRRVKLEYIGIGVIREFDGTELTGTQFINEIDLVSNSVPINVLDASFHSKSDAEYIFQRKQPVEAYNNNDLIGVYYIEKGERTSSRNYTVNCQDAIGVLDLDEYGGGIWLEDTPIETLIADVVNGMFEVYIDPALQGKTLRGYIPPDITRREALRHIAFASGACVDTTGTNVIKIFAPKTEGSAEIHATETYQGGKVTTSDTVTRVSVVGYEIYEREPYDGDESIEFNGVTYGATTHLMSAYNPNVSVSTLPNVIKFDGCYLIHEGNAQERADALLAYYMRRNTYSAKHIVRGQNMGDRAKVTTPWGDTSQANVLKMTITVSGIVASDTEFLLD